jgi:hypothetical protein
MFWRHCANGLHNGLADHESAQTSQVINNTLGTNRGRHRVCVGANPEQGVQAPLRLHAERLEAIKK